MYAHISPFPQLMQVLSDPTIASDIISWLPHGKGFVILRKRMFAAEVMPLHFKHSKFTSFTRKLNRWGFARVARGPEMGAYYNEVSYFTAAIYTVWPLSPEENSLGCIMLLSAVSTSALHRDF